MTGANLIAAWASAGGMTGVALLIPTCSLRMLGRSGRAATVAVVPLSTAILFAILAWRVGDHFDLLPFSVLAASGVALSLTDILAQRLPSVIVYPAIAVVTVLLATSAILHCSASSFLRALAGMATLTIFYLALAFLSGGGLGAGDVKLGGLLGVTLGWLSWSALVTATFLGWLTAALAWVLLRATRLKPADSRLPMGPFLLLGALLTITIAPT